MRKNDFLPVGIIGYGFVGSAIKHGLNHFNINDVKIYDPYKIPNSKIDDLINCKIIFICVPTPMGANGQMDPSYLCDVLLKLTDLAYKGIVVIKSTTTPVEIRELIGNYPELLINVNPEFLTERRAKQDFLNTEWVIIGTNNKELSQPLIDLHKFLFPKAEMAVLSPEGAMMVKYMTNTWFSVKVSLMNEFYNLWQKFNLENWSELSHAFGLDKRVGKTHLDVPGPDGDRGFGGRCFPKDMNAMMYMAKDAGTTYNVMKAAWEDNKVFRKNKDWLNIIGAVSESYQET